VLFLGLKRIRMIVELSQSKSKIKKYNVSSTDFILQKNLTMAANLSYSNVKSCLILCYGSFILDSKAAVLCRSPSGILIVCYRYCSVH